MSFSGEVKAELTAKWDKAAHCQLAELAAMVSGAGAIQRTLEGLHVSFVTENELAAEKYQRLLLSVADISADVERIPHMQQKNRDSFLVDVKEEAAVQRLLLKLKVIAGDGTMRCNMTMVDGLLLQKSCCKRAFLRGAYLVGGSMSDPKKSYHFEIVCGNVQKAVQLQEIFSTFGLEAKYVPRKKHQVLYLKEGEQIVDALNIMGAHVSLMNLENVRIFKGVRNEVNRRVNCETANINKTVNAAYRQQEAIRFLQQKDALSGLSEPLQEIASLRLEYPEVPIRELGALCIPKVGKSGVNHRLRKLEEIAEKMGHQLMP